MWQTSQRNVKKKSQATSTDKIFEKNSFEIVHYGKSSIALFKESFASIDKILSLGGRLGTRLYFHEVLTLF